MFRLLFGVWILCFFAWGQESHSGWQGDVRKSAEAQNWSSALDIVDREIARAPTDMDIRAWRARVLTWSGKLAEAEIEYRQILSVVSNDPDIWLGLGTVYSREGRPQEALKALDRAVQLDPKRSDIHAARAIALQASGAPGEAKLEFQQSLNLDPSNAVGLSGLVSLRPPARHELRLGLNTDLFSFADANQDEGISLNSHWTPHWATGIAAGAYHWEGREAAKIVASLTGKITGQGSLTVGAAAAHDNGVIPKNEGFFNYDQGFKLHRLDLLRGLEIVYGQHWYWYSTARVLTLNETFLFYLPRDWTWSLGVIEARSHFSGLGVEWRPSEMTRLGFPIANLENRHLRGSALFAVGTENFAQVAQIGEFSSRTFGGDLRLQITERQDVTGFAVYQMRSSNRTESSFGFTYGIRF